MTVDFGNLDYLRSGTKRQQAAWHVLTEAGLWPVLAGYQPILAGTIPLGIDGPDSDLDILCHTIDFTTLQALVRQHWGQCQDYRDEHCVVKGAPSWMASFRLGDFTIELFAQDIPSKQQDAYLHLLAEWRLLQHTGSGAIEAIRQLKAKGYKTEPAFALLYHLPGEAYSAVKALAHAPEEAICHIVRTACSKRG